MREARRQATSYQRAKERRRRRREKSGRDEVGQQVVFEQG
jgi:hypothetical protein